MQCYFQNILVRIWSEFKINTHYQKLILLIIWHLLMQIFVRSTTANCFAPMQLTKYELGRKSLILGLYFVLTPYSDKHCLTSCIRF